MTTVKKKFSLNNDGGKEELEKIFVSDNFCKRDVVCGDEKCVRVDEKCVCVCVYMRSACVCVDEKRAFR